MGNSLAQLRNQIGIATGIEKLLPSRREWNSTTLGFKDKTDEIFPQIVAYLKENNDNVSFSKPERVDVSDGAVHTVSSEILQDGNVKGALARNIDHFFNTYLDPKIAINFVALIDPTLLPWNEKIASSFPKNSAPNYLRLQFNGKYMPANFTVKEMKLSSNDGRVSAVYDYSLDRLNSPIGKRTDAWTHIPFP
jgi:hypothetical protein